jgi:hypothetical protein
MESEVADQQDLTGRLQQIHIEFPVLVAENSQAHYLPSQVFTIATVVAFCHTDINQ